MKPLRLLRCTAGASAVEFGLIAPVYFAALLGAIEARSGVQIVTAVIGKADHYVELPWV